MDLQGARALVTGASGGLGGAIAVELRAAGAHLVLHGRRKDKLAAVAEQTGGEIIVGDLGSPTDLDDLIERSLDVDVLVANAAVGGGGELIRLDRADIDNAIDVNLRAPMILARYMGERMVQRRRGHIVLVASLAAKATGAGASVYSATKFGLRGFGIGLRDDMAAHGVGVSVVLPGFIRGAGMFAEGGRTLPTGVSTNTPEDVGAAVRQAIERNRVEVTIAPLPVRLGAAIANVAPGPAAFIANRTPLGRLRPG